MIQGIYVDVVGRVKLLKVQGCGVLQGRILQFVGKRRSGY